MKRKAASGAVLTLLLIGVFNAAFLIKPALAESSGSLISVPHHFQTRSYYCGPAALEMVFDFYGPDTSQLEIADAARTSWAYGGTFTDDMRRAAHFSNLSTSVGIEMPGSVTGYSSRKLGYASFEHWGFTLEELKLLIDAGYPIVVLMWMTENKYFGHFRVVVGYNETHVMLLDPLASLMQNMTNSMFLDLWEYSYYWGLFVSPWEMSVSVPQNILKGDSFTVTATVTYPCPTPFSNFDYPTSSSNMTLTLPAGLSLVPGETAKKTIDAGYLAAGSSATVSWMVQADSSGTYTASVGAEGRVTGAVSTHLPYLGYSYEDRIGGTTSFSVAVTTPDPTEALQELIQTIEASDIGAGTRNSLTSKLEAAIHLLNIGNENGATHKLLDFISQVEALRNRKLTNEQADYLISEAQRIITLIEG